MNCFRTEPVQPLRQSNRWRSLLIACAAPLLFAFECAPDIYRERWFNEDPACQKYQTGRPYAEIKQVYSERDVYKNVRIQYDRRYIPRHISGGCDAPYCTSGAYDIDIETGRPASIEKEYTRNVKNYTHLGLTVDSFARPSLDGLFKTRYTNIRDNLTLSDFDVLGEDLQGYILVRYPAPWGTRTPTTNPYMHDVGIKTNDDGQITSILECKRPRSVPNPTCRVFEMVGKVRLKMFFNRKQLANIDKIIVQGRQFYSCLAIEEI